jgi:hypothetical protein
VVKDAPPISSALEVRDTRELTHLHSACSEADVLIIDELGFVPFGRAGGELLFNLITSDERRATGVRLCRIRHSICGRRKAHDRAARSPGALISPNLSTRISTRLSCGAERSHAQRENERIVRTSVPIRRMLQPGRDRSDQPCSRPSILTSGQLSMPQRRYERRRFRPSN